MVKSTKFDAPICGRALSIEKDLNLPIFCVLDCPSALDIASQSGTRFNLGENSILTTIRNILKDCSALFDSLAIRHSVLIITGMHRG